MTEKNEIIVLSKEEMQLIREHRLKNQAKQNKRDQDLHILMTAYHYNKWLLDNGAGSTYSTFCDDFKYQGMEGLRRDYVFKKVSEIIACVISD